MVDAHRGNILFHRKLHHPMKNTPSHNWVELNVFGNSINRKLFVAVGGNKLQHLADVKL